MYPMVYFTGLQLHAHFKSMLSSSGQSKQWHACQCLQVGAKHFCCIEHCKYNLGV